jgi:DNA-binding HxlR family transcriptional regulator
MSPTARTYGHFCLVARALERVGDRWTLLVVRDLLTGPKRFTDLMDRLGGITPTTLSQRLRELEKEGILTVDRVRGRREVWYSLTEAGSELAPIIDDLSRWGLRHSWRFPQPREQLHAEHLLRSAVQAIDLAGGDFEPTSWRLVIDDADYLVECDGHRWLLRAATSTSPVAVVVVATTEALARFIFAGPDDGVAVSGAVAPVRRFRRLIRTLADVVPPEAS